MHRETENRFRENSMHRGAERILTIEKHKRIQFIEEQRGF
jgi:hypothetical protein